MGVVSCFVNPPKQNPKPYIRLTRAVATVGIKSSGSYKTQHQSLQSFLKRFIVFDHSGEQWQIFLHPAVVQELSSSTVGTTALPERFVSGDDSVSADKLTAYRKTLASAFATLQFTRSSRLYDLSAISSEYRPSNSCLETHAAEIERTKSWTSHARGCPFSDGAEDCFSHENTEDIDALLSSDDEASSTGDSPGEQFVSEAEDSSNESHLQKRCRTISKTKWEPLNSSTSAGASSNSYVSVEVAESVRLCNFQDSVLKKHQSGQFICSAEGVEICSSNSSAESQNKESFISKSIRKGRKRAGL
eukprot:c19698_g2_i1 orf=89-997(-)